MIKYVIIKNSGSLKNEIDNQEPLSQQQSLELAQSSLVGEVPYP